MTTATAATIRSLPDEEYHALPDSLSRSQFKDFALNPALYEARYIAGLFPQKPKDAFDLGHVFEQAALAGCNATNPGFREVIAAIKGIPVESVTAFQNMAASASTATQQINSGFESLIANTSIAVQHAATFGHARNLYHVPEFQV